MGSATGKARGHCPQNLKYNSILRLAPPKFLEKQLYIVAALGENSNVPLNKAIKGKRSILC